MKRIPVAPAECLLGCLLSLAGLSALASAAMPESAMPVNAAAQDASAAASCGEEVADE